MHCHVNSVSDDSLPDCFDSVESLENELKTWSCSFNIPHSAMHALLKILRVYHTNLPKDPSTLLRTDTKYNVVSVDGGSYYHFGLAISVLKKIDKISHVSAFDIDSVLI